MSHPERKKSFVDPKVQGALVRRFVLHWFAFFLVASLVAFCMQVLSNPFRSLSEHAQQAWWTHGPFLLVMLFLLPAFVLDTIKLSHRFTGPIYRMRQTILEIAQGNSPRPIKFRDFDFWQGMAKDFNQMIDRLVNKKDVEPSKRDEPSEVAAEPVAAH